LAVNGGWSYRTPPLTDRFSPEEKEYIRKLKTGFAIGFDASYFFTEVYGAGFKYDQFKTSNSSLYGEDNILIAFIGPSFAIRLLNQSKTNCFFMSYSIGYMGFKDVGKQLGTPVTLKGSTAGFVMDIGYDITFSKNWSAGIQFSLLAGVISEFDETRNGITQTLILEKDQYEGLHRLNISIGLRYNL